MTTQELQKIQQEVGKLEALVQQYQKAFLEDGHLDTDEQQQLDRMQAQIDAARGRLKELEDEVAPHPLTMSAVEDLQEEVDGLLLKVVDVAEGCELVIVHYGSLHIKGQPLPQLFAINNEPTERLSVPANSEGSLSVVSSWVYSQKKTPWHEESARARRVFQLNYHYIADPDGTIHLQETSTSEVIHDWDREVSLFDLQRVKTKVSSRAIAIEGGLLSNKTMKEKVDDQFWNDVIQGATLDTWTVGVRLSAIKNTTFEPVASKELVFEKENQAVLSSDELRVLHRWWKELEPRLKTQIVDRKAKITVIGYASSIGDESYNWRLGQERANRVLSLLCDVIGRDETGNCIAHIRHTTEGEFTDDPRRCVKIIVE